MASGSSATFLSNTQVAGIHKLDELRRLADPINKITSGPAGPVRGSVLLGSWLDVRLFLGFFICRGTGRLTGGNFRVGISSMAICTTQLDGVSRVHARAIGTDVTTDAALTLGIGLVFSLARKSLTGRILRSGSRSICLRRRGGMGIHNAHDQRHDKNGGKDQDRAATTIISYEL